MHDVNDDKLREYVVFGSPQAQARILTRFNSYFEQLDTPALCLPSATRGKLTSGAIAAELAKEGVKGVVFDRPQALDDCPDIVDLNADASAIGLVSAIKKSTDGHYVGALFDSLGMAAHLQRQGLSFKNLSVLVLGASAQSAAAALAAIQNGAVRVDLIDPRQHLAEKLSEQLRKLGDISIGISVGSGRYDVIINTWSNQTMLQESVLANYFQVINNDGWAVDTGLSLQDSKFLEMAQSQGVHTFSGIPNLRRQVRYYLDFFGELE
jgi:shikimate 5-dehydrogenase